MRRFFSLKLRGAPLPLSRCGSGAYSSLSSLLDDLAVDREIEHFPLSVGVDAQPNHEIDQLQQDQRGDRVVNDGASDTVELHEHLVRIAVDQAAMSFAADRRDG